MTLKPLRPDPAKDPNLAVEHSALASENVLAVIGIDEVGRGAIAGPVAVGAHVFLRGDSDIPTGLRDSKLLSEKRRETVLPSLLEWGSGAVGFSTAEEVDRFGITAMLGEAARRALLELHGAGLEIERCVILLDGAQDWITPVLRAPLNIVTRVGADRECASVAAASVRAKVDRDQVMRDAHVLSPQYEWHSNKGYGSAAHYRGIAAHGLNQMHRKSWIKRT